MKVMSGGYNTYGHKLGILMLDTKFPRPVGDMGNANTWSYPVLYKIVKGASVDKVVKKGERQLIPRFIEAAKELESQGVQAITTNCGFLALFQKEIQQHLETPFISSNLMQIPLVYQIFGEFGKVGVLTASKSTLTKEHFTAVNADNLPLAIEGMDNSNEFNKTIINQAEIMDLEIIEKEIVNEAKKIIENHQNVRAIVLECTNLTPYIESIKEAVKVPVFDIVTFVNAVVKSLNPQY